MSVRIFPRRKAGENSVMGPSLQKGRAPLKFDRNSIQPLFAMPQKDAARMLGISVTALKKVCRKLGIPTWAHVRDTPLVPPNTAEHDTKPKCKPSLDEFVGAVEDDIFMRPPVPEDSEDLTCEDHSSDCSTSASSMASSPIQETIKDAGIKEQAGRCPMKAGSSDAPCHDSNDLAFLVPLPSGFMDVPDSGKTAYTNRWLMWYEESSKSFDI